MQSLVIPKNISVSIVDHTVQIQNTATNQSINFDMINLNMLPFHKRNTTKKYFNTIEKLFNNNISGLYKGYLLKVQLLGIGYRVSHDKDTNTLTFKLGYSHDVIFEVPKDISVYITRSNKIILIGADLKKVSQVASKIKQLRKPDNYKGKGIRYVNEKIILKEGKKRK